MTAFVGNTEAAFDLVTLREAARIYPESCNDRWSWGAVEKFRESREPLQSPYLYRYTRRRRNVQNAWGYEYIFTLERGQTPPSAKDRQYFVSRGFPSHAVDAFFDPDCYRAQSRSSSSGGESVKLGRLLFTPGSEPSPGIAPRSVKSSGGKNLVNLWHSFAGWYGLFLTRLVLAQHREETDILLSRLDPALASLVDSFLHEGTEWGLGPVAENIYFLAPEGQEAPSRLPPQGSFCEYSRMSTVTSEGGGTWDLAWDHAMPCGYSPLLSMYVHHLWETAGVVPRAAEAGEPIQVCVVSRRETPYRHLENIDAVLEYLERFCLGPRGREDDGALDTVPSHQVPLRVREVTRRGEENAPFVEQIREAHECDVMIGPHGAGLTHVVFMRPGGALIEILRDRQGDKESYYRNLAHLRGHSYASLLLPPDASDNFVVDLPVLRKLLDAVLISSIGSRDGRNTRHAEGMIPCR
uniref:Glycosyltransferase 61 catalytic domain-containing protein n=1 Tax=Chromera velia CCMP2878 TaxID=1169474 RepID=A0A0G4F0J0_9ALVE|eukprot:Cvel_14582.t1-p1 / transcript=Cvel_14582.t1 / gene=Cvel_14582 / organism=Chromera_velia_CCMP2878 / gene_product=hypothetical protein / transcript_product=hypothetical protein / location=Cvel_scaffold1042:42994-45156(-) / protein_length=465 / sequence_SO=supercontig / SO=protein_coding / is_pseudo=false